MAAAGLRSGLRGRSLWLALLGPLARGNRSPGFPRLQVGSRAGAVFRRPGLAVAPRFLWECLTSPAVNPSPAPATSNGAGGFPALRFPVRFTPRLMRPTAAAALSAAICRLLHLTRPIRPSPRRISPASGLADRRVLFSRHPCLPYCRRSYEQQGPFAPRPLRRFPATTSPSATLSSSADFPVLPVIRPTQLPPFPVGTRRASPVARCVLVVVPSLTTPPEQLAASIGLRRAMQPSPYSCGLGLRGYCLSGPPRVHLCYGPATRTHPKGEVVEGLQRRRSPSGLPSQLRGFRFLPRQD